MKIKIASWNVNGVKARLNNLIVWLMEEKPDIVLLQETKTIDDDFPFMEIEELGYNIEVHGQKTYNGVAILAKFPIEDIEKNLQGEDDEQARYIEGVISVPAEDNKREVIRIASVYVPNGQAPEAEKFQYKMRFFDHLADKTEKLLSYEEKLVIGGDYNVAPQDIDVYDPSSLRGKICFHPDEQAKLRTIIYQGYSDAFRTIHPNICEFSWWDYRGGGYRQNKGMRIDHLLLSPMAADALDSCEIDEKTREVEKASDHAPIWCELII